MEREEPVVSPKFCTAFLILLLQLVQSHPLTPKKVVERLHGLLSSSSHAQPLCMTEASSPPIPNVQLVFSDTNLMGLLLGQENVLSASVKEEVTVCEGFRAF